MYNKIKKLNMYFRLEINTSLEIKIYDIISFKICNILI